MLKGTAVEVRLWDSVVGYAYWDGRLQCAQFRYAPSFLDEGFNVAPVTMPLSDTTFVFDSLNRDTYHGLPGLLSDSLPDSYGNALIDVWLSGAGIPMSEFTPLDRLCYVGGRGMGALEYEPVIGNADVNEKIDVDMLSSLASEVLSQKENFRADMSDKGLRELLSVGTSAGGARAKATVGLNESTGEIRSGQLNLPSEYTYWIIKFDTETGKKRGYCRIEYAYHEMARACGVDMTECRLLDTGSRAHFMTRRFDRTADGKVHMLTLCALAHYDYKVPGRYSYEEALGIMRALNMPYVDMEQMFRRMVFNVIMRNQDDHTKNITFLMGRDGAWRLSPAYDITYAFDPNNYWMHQHQMSLNGKLRDIGRSDLMEFARKAGIRDPKDVIDTTVSVASEWRDFANRSGVPKETVEAIGRKLLMI